METSMWLERWESGNTPFHRDLPNEALVAHLGKLNLAECARIFLPLCGASVDLDWLMGKGFKVAGAELSALAVEQVFARLGLTPTVTQVGALTRYSAKGIDLFAGDIFELDAAALGPVDASYDRAALIALPPEVRKLYAAHMTKITAGAPQMLLGIEYDQSKMDGPPFSVDETEVRGHYSGAYDIQLLKRNELPDGIKGITEGAEAIWHLKGKAE